MEKLKKILSLSAIFTLLVGVIAFSSCADDDDTTSAVATVTGYSPSSSSVEIGDELELSGSGLGLVGSITVGGLEAAMEYVNDQLVKFTIPEGLYTNEVTGAGIEGTRYSETIRVFYADKSQIKSFSGLLIDVIYDTPTGWIAAADSRATVDGEVSVGGYKLTDVTSVTVTGTAALGSEAIGSLEVSSFVLQTANELTFAIPNGTYEMGNNYVEVTLNFADGSYTASSRFNVAIPYPYPTEETAAATPVTLYVEGLNLDLVSKVSFAGVEVDLEYYGIDEDSGKELYSYTFLYDDEDPYTNPDVANGNVYTQDVIFCYGNDRECVAVEDFELTAMPPAPTMTNLAELNAAVMTVGDLVTLEGYFLDMVESITISDVTIKYGVDDEFVSQAADEITFRVPAATYDAATGDNVVTIKLTYDTDEVNEDIDAFTVAVPVIDPALTDASGSYAYIYTIAGYNLDLITDLTYVDVAATIVEDTRTETSIEFSIPYDESFAGYAVANIVTENLLGYYGTAKNEMTIIEFALDVEYNATPRVSAVAVTNGADINKTTTDYGVYLNSQVTLTGYDLDKVTTVHVGDVEATIDSGASSTSLTFTMSDDYTYTTATSGQYITFNKDATAVELGDTYDFKVYPFYYYKDAQLNARSNTDKSKFAFNLETGLNISADNANTFDKALAGTSVDYSSVDPYLLYLPTGDKICFYGPSKASGMIKNYKDSSATSVTGGNSNAGTPNVLYRVLSPSDAASIAMIAKTFEDQTSFTAATSGNPVGAPNISGCWDVYNRRIGDSSGTYSDGVLGLTYYDSTSTNPVKCGLILVTALKNGEEDFTHINTSAGTGSIEAWYDDEDLTTTVTFDVLWPKYKYGE